MKFKAFYIFGQKTVDVKTKFKSGYKDILYGGLINCRCETKIFCKTVYVQCTTLPMVG